MALDEAFSRPRRPVTARRLPSSTLSAACILTVPFQYFLDLCSRTSAALSPEVHLNDSLTVEVAYHSKRAKLSSPVLEQLKPRVWILYPPAAA